MKRLAARGLGLLVVAFALAGCAQPPGQAGWVALVDGETGLENWDRNGDANWRAEGGAMVDFATVSPMPKVGGTIKWRKVQILPL